MLYFKCSCVRLLSYLLLVCCASKSLSDACLQDVWEPLHAETLQVTTSTHTCIQTVTAEHQSNWKTGIWNKSIYCTQIFFVFYQQTNIKSQCLFYCIILSFVYVLICIKPSIHSHNISCAASGTEHIKTLLLYPMKRNSIRMFLLDRSRVDWVYNVWERWIISTSGSFLEDTLAADGPGMHYANRCREGEGDLPGIVDSPVSQRETDGDESYSGTDQLDSSKSDFIIFKKLVAHYYENVTKKQINKKTQRLW